MQQGSHFLKMQHKHQTWHVDLPMQWGMFQVLRRQQDLRNGTLLEWPIIFALVFHVLDLTATSECVIRISKTRQTQSILLLCVSHISWSGFSCIFAIFIFFKGRWFTLWAIVIRSSSLFSPSLLPSLSLFFLFHFYTIYRSYFSHSRTFHTLHIFLDRFTLQMVKKKAD